MSRMRQAFQMVGRGRRMSSAQRFRLMRRRFGRRNVQAPWYAQQRFRGRHAKNGQPELKFHDLDIDDAVIAAGVNNLGSLNLIAQGVTESERIGRNCVVRSVFGRWEITLPLSTASSGTSDVVRVILVLDKQANGANGGASGATGLLETNDFQSFNNLANKSRFRVLMDRTYSIESKAGGGDGTTEDYGEAVLTDTIFKKCNIKIELDAAAGVITEVRSNNIMLFVSSRSGLAGFGSKWRLRFSDS